MNILHISNDFPNSALYKQLVLHLKESGLKQRIYSAVRTEKEAQYSPPELNHLEVNIRNILHPYDRLLYRNKVCKIFKDVTREIKLEEIDIVHAHTLYSDGGVALRLKEQFGIPYIVVIRNTDINAFQKFRPDLRWRRNKILSKAEKVILKSPSYRKRLLELLGGALKLNVIDKANVIPNGIDSTFLRNPPIINRRGKNTILKLLYVGSFEKLKNVPNLIRVCNMLNKQDEVELTLVGGDGKDEKKIKDMISSGVYPFIKYLGKVTDRERLRKIYANNDIFVMVSDRETFGLVYVEALSQGVPIVNTKGEGIDGYFERETVAEAVIDTYNLNEIAEKIKKLSNRLNKELKKECIRQSRIFSWDKIAEKYSNIYQNIDRRIK